MAQFWFTIPSNPPEGCYEQKFLLKDIQEVVQPPEHSFWGSGITPTRPSALQGEVTGFYIYIFSLGSLWHTKSRKNFHRQHEKYFCFPYLLRCLCCNFKYPMISSPPPKYDKMSETKCEEPNMGTTCQI